MVVISALWKFIIIKVNANEAIISAILKGADNPSPVYLKNEPVKSMVSLKLSNAPVIMPVSDYKKRAQELVVAILKEI